MSGGSYIAVFIVLVIAIWIRQLGIKYDRERIRANVEAGGGKVISIQVHLTFWRRNRYDSPYDVTYTTHEGHQITALCYTSRRNGVQWVTDVPPGS